MQSALLAGVLTAYPACAAPLAIDLTAAPSASTELQLSQGSNRDPQGHVLTADSQSLLLDGQPWVAVAGEFHFGRYARPEWRDELLKMKAGGCTAVSTYVFWIWHEEEQGHWDWSGQRCLREFVQLCQEVGLKMILRVGPWAHGEVRNGGLPDWVQNSHTRLRTDDPAFLALVRPFFEQIAEQTRGLYWKDGGPIFAVQVDNECNHPEYLVALKVMAREVGIDAPLYLMTGWGGVRIPKQELLPVFGAYPWAFWDEGGAILDSFVFSLARNSKEMGAQLTTDPTAPPPPPVLTPYLTAELGGGMQSSYTHRILIDPNDIAAINLVRLGDGNTMPGFYMYHGGINPMGKLSFLNEARPNPMPVMDYDFQAPLGACGEVRGQYHLLREQNLFLRDFGAGLIRMPAYLPIRRPEAFTDVTTLRWAVRWNDGAGFLLFNNRAPELTFPDHPGSQFELETAEGARRVPAEPITIPAGGYGIWPLHLDCRGVHLEYATAQPLCYTDVGRARWYFFKALPGIDPDFVFARRGARLTAGKEDASSDATHLRLRNLVPGTTEAFALTKEDGSAVHFVLLDAERAGMLWSAPFAGRDRVFLSKSTVLADHDGLRLQTDAEGDLSFAIFPPVNAVVADTWQAVRSMDGVFARFTPSGQLHRQPLEFEVEQIRAADTAQPELLATDEDAWKNAAIWKLRIPPAATGKHLLAQIHYLADAARLYAGDTLLDDNYCNSKPFAFGLWRIPLAQWSTLTLKIVPYSASLLPRLPHPVRQRVADLLPSERNQVTATLIEQIEWKIAPEAEP